MKVNPKLKAGAAQLTSATKKLLDLANRNSFRHAGTIPLPVLKEGQGSVVVDTDGKEYIDISSGQMAVTVGHNHPKVVEAIKKSADKLIHINHLLHSEESILLATRLAEFLPKPLKKVLLLNTGSEANEAGIKIAKMHTGNYGVVSIVGGYHGHTAGALSVTFRGKNSAHRGFGPNMPGSMAIPIPNCYRCPLKLTFPSCEFACANVGFDLIDAQSVQTPAVFIGEPIMSSAGIIEPPQGYFEHVKNLCRERGMLFMLDESQTGLGRLGTMFGFEDDGAQPDLLVLSKTMGGGVPVSALVTTDVIENDVVDKGFFMRTSHMGDPLTAAAGLAVLDVIENDRLAAQARIKGQYLKNKLLQLKEMHPIIGDVRGRGLLLGIEFVKDPVSKELAVAETAAITAKCLELGLLIDAPGGARKGQALWRIAPPITTSYNQIDSAVEIIDEAIKAVIPTAER